jgi:arsenical-resistance protein 2
MESCVLEGGVKGWATSGEEYVTMMDGYEATAWQ